MDDDRPADDHSPTIVGPQSTRSGGRRPKTPGGLERLLALACLNGAWREKVLADPLAAADEAGLALSGSEKAVVRSVPAEALEAMVGSFSRRTAAAKTDISRAATWAAAAALLAANLTGCDAIESVLGARSAGLEVDEPPAKEAPAEKKKEKKESADPKDRAEANRIKIEFQTMPVVTGIMTDEPPSKNPNSMDRMLFAPPSTGTIQSKPAPQGGSPIEEALPQNQNPQPAAEPADNAPVSRGISVDTPESRSDR